MADIAENNDELAVVLLAAGASRRFNGCKQVAALAGESLLIRAVRLADSVAPGQVHLVLGARSGMIRAHLTAHRELLPLAPPTLIENRDWQQGLGVSLARGIAALKKNYRGVLIILADQVALSADDLSTLVAAWRAGAGIACAEFEGGFGVPAVFDRRHFPALATLAGDRGAKGLIKAHDDEVTRVWLPAAGVDIDTLTDYRQWLSRPSVLPENETLEPTGRSTPECTADKMN